MQNEPFGTLILDNSDLKGIQQVGNGKKLTDVM